MGDVIEFRSLWPRRDPQDTYEDISDAVDLIEGCVDDFKEGTVLRAAVESSGKALGQVLRSIRNGNMDF